MADHVVARAAHKPKVLLTTFRVGLSLAERVSRPLAVTAAARLFTMPRRFPRPAREMSLLDRAERFALGPQLIAAWKWGDGPIVVLVHGWEGRGAQLGSFVEPLLEAGFSVVTFDAPGHGSSHGMRTTVPDFAEALLAIERRFGSVHAVIGHSFAGPGVAVALQRGFQPRCAVLIAPPSCATHALNLFSRQMALSPDVRDGMQRQLETLTGLKFEALDVRHYGPRMNTPLLLVHDRDDGDVGLASSRAFLDHWRNSSLLETEGLGHYRILRDGSVVQRIVQYVARHAPDAEPVRELDRALELDGAAQLAV